MSDRELLLAACADNEEVEVRRLLSEGSLTADDATAAVKWAHEYPAILRSVLEHGGDPNTIRIETIRSFESLKALHEFGFDVQTQGHLILQCVSCHSVQGPTDQWPGISQMTRTHLTGFLIKEWTSTRPTLAGSMTDSPSHKASMTTPYTSSIR